MDILEELKNYNKDTIHVHCSNIIWKIENKDFETKKEYSLKIWEFYLSYIKSLEDELHKDNLNFSKITNLLNEYKDNLSDINKKANFSSQSKLEPTVLEEFVWLLFQKDLDNLCSNNIDAWNKKIYCNLYFSPTNIYAFEKETFITLNEKDQDFSIFRTIKLEDENGIETEIHVPIISIECKTYLDKTMLEWSIATAEKIKSWNPYSCFFIVTERYAVDSSVDPAYSRIDQIYVLRKEKHSKQNVKKCEEPIHPDVIEQLYNDVKKHLYWNWSNIDQKIKDTWLLI